MNSLIFLIVILFVSFGPNIYGIILYFIYSKKKDKINAFIKKTISKVKKVDDEKMFKLKQLRGLGFLFGFFPMAFALLGSGCLLFAIIFSPILLFYFFGGSILFPIMPFYFVYTICKKNGIYIIIFIFFIIYMSTDIYINIIEWQKIEIELEEAKKNNEKIDYEYEREIRIMNINITSDLDEEENNYDYENEVNQILKED